MPEQKQDDQLEHTYSSYVRIRDVTLKTCQRQWMIERSGERGSGISVLEAWHDDDDDDIILAVQNSSQNMVILYIIFYFLINFYLLIECCNLLLNHLISVYLLVWILWHINLQRLFNAKFSYLYIYIYIYI